MLPLVEGGGRGDREAGSEAGTRHSADAGYRTNSRQKPDMTRQKLSANEEDLPVIISPCGEIDALYL